MFHHQELVIEASGMVKPGANEDQVYRKLEIVEGYDTWAPTYDEEKNPLIALEENITLDLIGNVRNKRALDVGCGTGRYCELLAKKGAKMVGIDPSSKMLEIAKRKIAPDSRFELRLGRMENTGLPDRYFDVVVCALVVGHLPDLEPAIREVSRIIKTKGRLVVSDMHPYWFVSGYDYVKFLGRSGQEYRIPEYTHLYEEYWNLFRKFKFGVQDVKEPRIDDTLIQRFPGLRKYEDMPLALILRARKE
ncbi:MAG TPA: class I SAM-dependent methyltransferase [Candidatus Bathyarchaeia archaeon]|nr:class I SAM-dependent methyltransferase [Candidatus Bathyarchaeia archaeon]